MDTTFFGRYFCGVLVLMDSKTKNKVVCYHFIRTERIFIYKLALNRLREKAI